MDFALVNLGPSRPRVESRAAIAEKRLQMTPTLLSGSRAGCFVLAGALVATGCRTNHQPFTNPLGADRVPAPATRVIQPGTAQPYYPGDALPATGLPATGLPATGLPATGQIVAPQAGFGAAAPPAAFGQQQQPIVQAQPFTAQPFTAQPLPAQP
ncbi:MAG: hypothetical protein AAGI08_18635, partial [Bacteroidota bacterium]